MDVATIKQVVEPFVQLAGTLMAAAVANAWIVEYLKSKVFPVPASKYPRTTNLVTSIAITLAVVYMTPFHLVLTTWWEVASFVVMLFVVTAWCYRIVVAGGRPEALK